MHILPGTLLVEEINGRRGTFCVGTLQTSIGDFKVKDAALDQFKSGLYEGSFTIEKIYTKGVPWRGGFFTELIAKIAPDGYLIDFEDERKPDAQVPLTQAEPDPLDEKIEHSSVIASVSEVPAAAKAVEPDLSKRPARISRFQTPVGFDKAVVKVPTKVLDTSAVLADDETLFGVELFSQLKAREPEIALDSTVDREVLRLQCRRLGKLDYAFDSRSQKWRLPLHVWNK